MDEETRRALQAVNGHLQRLYNGQQYLYGEIQKIKQYLRMPTDAKPMAAESFKMPNDLAGLFNEEQKEA